MPSRSSPWRRASAGSLLALVAVTACDAAPAPATHGTGAATAGLVVVCTDYASTSVSLLDAAGRQVTADPLVHSGSATPGVQTALSGDVELPTTAPPDGSVLLIDRSHAVLTFMDPATGAVRRQVAVGSGFAANPHDALVLPDGRLLVTRYDPNPHPAGGDALDAGDDLLVLDAAGTARYALPLTDPDGFPFRPDRLLAVGDGVWVTGSRASLDWQAYRPARVVVVEPGDGGSPPRAARTLDPVGLRNCGGLARLGATVAVACGGAWVASASGFEPGSSAVVVMSELGVEVARLAATDPRLGGRVLAPGLTSDGAGGLWVALFGDGIATNDAVAHWRVDDDDARVAYEADEPWVLWATAAADDGVAVAAIGDRRAPRACRLDPVPTCYDPCGSTGLPPHAIGRYFAPPAP